MKYFSCLFLFVFFSVFSVFSQEKYTQHTVAKGETISEIAAQYNVKPSAIYKLNPKAKKGIKYHTVLLIPAKSLKITKPSPSPEVVTNSLEKTHKVLPKETLYGIAKLYNVSIQDLYKINPKLEKEGLKKGENINIPSADLDNLAMNTVPDQGSVIKKTNIQEKKSSKVEITTFPKSELIVENATQELVREVLPKETKYSIAKQYGIKVADLQKANPTIGKHALKLGQKITIPLRTDFNSGLTDKKESLKMQKEIVVVSQAVIENKTVETEITREVLAKETKYGIAKEYGISVAELEKQNPEITKNLPIGYVLKIRSSKAIETPVVVKEEVLVKESRFENANRNLNSSQKADFAEQLISTALENIGTRYRSGGTTKEGFDCSGFMCYTFNSNDIQLPRSSIEMANYGYTVKPEEAQKGDLIFFKTRGGRQINHVGMVVEVCEGEIKFIHSSTSSGVIISSTKENYYKRNFIQINHVL